MDYLPSPALQKLLLSAGHHLVCLFLAEILHSGYTSPEAMVTCLAAATSIEFLNIRFQSPQSCPNRASRHLPLLIHTILPTLIYFIFHGISEYLEDFISQVDTPLLKDFYLNLFHQLTFDVSQLHQFIRHAETLSALNIARVDLEDSYTTINLSHQIQLSSFPRMRLSTSCNGSDWQLSFAAQACNSFSLTLSTLETPIVHKDEF